MDVYTLTEKELYALVSLEMGASEYNNKDLIAAKQKLSQAEEALAIAKKEVNLVEGAVQGAQIMIQRHVASRGLSMEQYVTQRDAYLKSELAKQNEKATLDAIPEAPEGTTVPVEAVIEPILEAEESEVIRPIENFKKRKRN